MSKIEVVEIRGKKSFAGPGVYGYDAEARVALEDGSELYVGVNEYDDFRHYTVSGKSVYDEMTGTGTVERDEKFEAWVASQRVGYDGPLVENPIAVDDGNAGDGFLEEYGKLSETKDSKYHDVFVLLNKMVRMMEKGA